MANTLNLGNGNWATKEDSLLAYNSENGNFKPLPFDFTRDTVATVVNKAGLIETVGSGEPRIDYKDDSKGALLLEPTRTNLITYSEDFSQSEWNKQAIGTASLPVVTSNYGVSPDGTQNADRLQLNLNGGTTGADLSYMTDYLTATGTTTTSSVYIKSLNSTTNIGIRTGSVIKSVDIGTEWQRFYVSDLTSSNRFQFLLYGHLNSQSADLLIYGAQTEQGSYATSYIPTQGGAVTRVAESCIQTPPSGIIGQTEGTIYFESEINGLQGGDMRFQLSDGSTNNWIFISSGEATGIGVKCRAYINNGNVNQFNTYSEYLSAGKHKYALAYNQNDIALYVDGVQVALDTSATIPSCNEITLAGSTPTSTNSLHFLKYDDLKLYNTRLSNAELQALTTL